MWLYFIQLALTIAALAAPALAQEQAPARPPLPAGPPLENVSEFYDRGGHANAQLDRAVRPLDLKPAEKRALLTFLRALRGVVREGAW